MNSVKKGDKTDHSIKKGMKQINLTNLIENGSKNSYYYQKRIVATLLPLQS